MSQYQVKLEKFEGPMELLLELIEKEDLSITEVSLSKVTNQYLEHLKNAGNIHLAHMAEFLSVAAKLILIKSRALLPELKFTDEEESEIRDLEKQLSEFKKFKDAAARLGKMEARERIAYSREGYRGIGTMFYPPENFNIFDFKKHFLKILSEIPVVAKLEEEIVREVITLEEKISHMSTLLKDQVEASFSQIVSTAKDKIEIIVSFLAILEMAKQRIISVKQEELFKDIRLSLSVNK